MERQKPLPVMYDGIRMDAGYRVDLLVNELAPISQAQLMTYLKLSGLTLGLLRNFNVQDMKKGIDRIIV